LFGTSLLKTIMTTHTDYFTLQKRKLHFQKNSELRQSRQLMLIVAIKKVTF